MTSPAISARTRLQTPPSLEQTLAPLGTSSDSAERSFFCGDTSDWLALRPGEQAEVILAAYQERLLPDLVRIEKLLTRLAVEFGLEYCHLDEIAVGFLAVTREIRQHVQSFEAVMVTPGSSVVAGRAPVGKTNDMPGLVARLGALTRRCAAVEPTSTCLARLSAALQKSERELAELVDLENALSR